MLVAAEARYGVAVGPIVDTHQHLWDLHRLTLPWVAPSSTSPGHPALAHNFLPADYRAATAGLNIVQAVYVEVDVVASQVADEGEYVLDICRRGGEATTAAIIAGRPAAADFTDHVKRFAGEPHVKGMRQVLHVPEAAAGTCLGKDFVAGMRLLAANRLSFDLCMRPGELRDAAELATRCPETRLVLDHCGNVNVAARDYEQWRRDIDAVARRENVACKVSGIIESATPGSWTAEELAPVVNHVFDVFGPQRVMFGSNWPVCTLNGTLRQWVEALREIVANRPDAEQRQLFHDNAVRWYRL